jgi:hypothetical protein
MRREVTNKTIRQRAVVIILACGALTAPVFVLRRPAVGTFGVTGPLMPRPLARPRALAFRPRAG